jgi:hypothetical protein
MKLGHSHFCLGWGMGKRDPRLGFAMARTIIFYGTLCVAAFMLALDTGIKRSPDLLAKFSFVKSQIWGFLPLILLLIFGGIAIYDYFVLRPAVPNISRNEIPSTQQSPLASDALKWKLQQHLRTDFAAISPDLSSCQIVIVHYQSDYSENLTQSLADVLTAAGCKTRDFYSETMLPGGVTLRTLRSEPLDSYLRRIKERLRSDAGIVATDDSDVNPVFHIPEQRPIAAGLYGEIIIGNEPKS